MKASIRRFYGAPVVSPETALRDVRAELSRLILSGTLSPALLDAANMAASKPEVLRPFLGLEPRSAALAALERLTFR